MKRQKRDRSDLALSRGYQAGFEGLSKEKCPFGTGEIRHQWLAGWREGREDHWNGFNGAACAQRVANLHSSYY